MMGKNPHGDCFSRRSLLLDACAVLLAGILLPRAARALDGWQKVKAFGVELDVPAGWKRFDFHKPPGDHDEAQFAENARNPSAGAWFSVFPNNAELLDPDLTERPITIDGREGKTTDMLTRAEDPPPRRRQIMVYFSDSRAPAFLFDGNAEQWSVLGPVLDRILASIRLPKP